MKKLFQIPWLSSALAILLGLYYGTLDIWGDEWTWIKDYKNWHAWIYSILMLLTIISVIYKTYLNYKSDKLKFEDDQLLKNFLSFIKNIVHAKRTRFYDKVSRLDTTTKRINFFEEITHPKEQIRYIMAQAVKFFEYYGVESGHLEMTVLGAHTTASVTIFDWKYLLQLDRQRQHTDPNQLMNNPSIAKQAILRGEPIFLADLQEGVDQNIFYKSSRSENANNVGSIYCKPVTIKIQGITYKFVFTIVSYGTYLCSPNSEAEAKQLAILLDEIGDRIELELYLLAMTQHRKR